MKAWQRPSSKPRHLACHDHDRLDNTSMQRRCMGMHRCKAQPLSRGDPPDAEGLMDAAAPEAVQPEALNTHQAKAGVHVAIKRHGLLLLQAEGSLKLTLQQERMQPQFLPSAKAIIKRMPRQHALLQPPCRHAAAALAACRCRQGEICQLRHHMQRTTLW